MHNTTDSIKAAEDWVHNKVWRNDLMVNLSPMVDSLEFERQYNAARSTWDKVFDFLADDQLASLAPGKYEVDGDNAYAMVTEAPSKASDDIKWESHLKYTDLQYVIRGEEQIEIAPLSTLDLSIPYNETKDVMHFTGNGTYYTADPQTFFLFFPNDVHRPNIIVEGFEVVKKLVIKIKYVQ